MANSSGAQNHSESSVDGSREKAPNFTPRSQALAVDQRWQASQGIMFSTLAQNSQAWQPPLGINFSLSNPVPRQPYSTSSGSTPAATSPIKATLTSSPMTSHSRDRYIPSPRPYQPSKSPKALGSDLFSSGAAAEEDLVMDDDEDIGKLLERASREKLQPTNKIPILAPESMDTTTGPAKIDHDAVSPEPLTVTPLKPFTRIAPSEAKAPRVPKGSATSSNTPSPPTDAPKRNTRPVKIPNLRVGAVNTMEIRKPRDARPRNQSEIPSPASSPQRPSESEIKRLAQMPNRPMTARSETKGLVSGNNTGQSAKHTNLELMYVHGELIKCRCYSIVNQLRDLHSFYLSHPTYHPTLLDPLEIQDLLDEFNDLNVETEHEIHQLRFVMWRMQELKQTLSEQGPLEGSEIALRLHIFYVLNPFHENEVSQMNLRRAFQVYDRYCQRRGREFMAKSIDGIKGQHGLFKWKSCSLRALVYYCTGSWQEVEHYKELIRRASESDVWLHHPRDLGSSWRRVVQAVSSAKKVMRESPGGLVRLSGFSRVFNPLYHNYRAIESALKDFEKTRQVNSRLGSSTATNIPDLHDKPDLPSDPLSMASASTSVAAGGEEDVRTRFIEFQSSLVRLLSCLQKWTDTLTVSERRAYESKEILTASRVRSLRRALELLTSIQSKATLNRRVFPTTVGAAEASADVEAIPVPLPDLNHKPLAMAETCEAETQKSSGISDRRNKRPSKSRKLKYVKGFQIRRIHSDRTLSQGTISALGSEKAVQRKSLSDARIAKRGSLKSSLIQKRAIHCSPTYGPSVEVESELPSTLLGSSNFTSCGPLGYRITDTILEGATHPDQNTKPLHWEYTLYRSPLGEKIKVHYCKTKADTERITRLFFDEEVLGFDIEWKPNATAKEGIKKNVALIQIASEERIALFHIARFRGEDTVDDLVTPTFKYIMQTPRITKVGVSIKADCTRLRRYMGIESRGLFELSHLYKLVKHSPSNASSVDKRLVRLAAQVEEHLGLPLWKGQDVRGSDWSSADLNYQQVQYAASDSYAGFQLYHTLEHKRLALDPTPPRPYHAELNLPIRLSSGLSIPTDGEQTDLEDDPPTVDDPTNPPSVEELTHDFLTMKIKTPLSPLHKPSKTPHKPPPKPPTPEYTTAQSWATTYRAALPFPHKPSVSPASLRAYALWHEQGHTVPEAAALLRDPPLQNATVAVYVLEALRLEKLPFERGRLEALLEYVPMGGRGRYRGFLGGCGIGAE